MNQKQQLSHAEQFRLYHSDRAAWFKFAAPVIAQRMRKAGADEKRRMWDLCSPELQRELKKKRMTTRQHLAREFVFCWLAICQEYGYVAECIRTDWRRSA